MLRFSTELGKTGGAVVCRRAERYRPEELRHAITNDCVVAAHYSDFDASNAWAVKRPVPKMIRLHLREINTMNTAGVTTPSN